MNIETGIEERRLKQDLDTHPSQTAVVAPSIGLKRQAWLHVHAHPNKK